MVFTKQKGSICVSEDIPQSKDTATKTLYDDALILTGYGKFNLSLLLVCGICLLTVQSETLSAGYILPAACDLNLSAGEKGLFTSITFIGIIAGSHFWGFMADTRGRKRIIQISLLCSFLSTLLASFMPDFRFLIACRFFTGFFLSAPSAAIYAYLGEFHAIKYRAKSLAWSSVLLAVGIILTPALAWLIIPQNWTFKIYGSFNYSSWRLFMVACGIPSVVCALGLIPFPESPKFLMTRGRHVKALNILKQVYSINMGKCKEEFPVHGLHDHFEINEEKEQTYFMAFMKKVMDQTVPLFCAPYLRNTILLFVILFGVFAISTGLLLWFPEIVNRMAEISSLNPGKEVTVCETLNMLLSNSTESLNNTVSELTGCTYVIDVEVYTQNLIIGFAYAIGYILIGMFVNKFGTKAILVCCCLLPGICSLLLHFTTNPLLVKTLFIVLLVVSGFGPLIASMIVIDIFPTYIRAMAVCISLMVGKLGNVVASSVIGILLDFNCNITFVGFTVLLLVCGVLSFLLPDTSKDA